MSVAAEAAGDHSASRLSQALGMPDEVVTALRRCENELFADGGLRLDPLIVRFSDREAGKAVRHELHRLLSPDPDGFRMLCCMLRAACEARFRYHALGISDDVFVTTMRCFTRFVGEHRVSYGRYGFDRDFWTIRQLSLRLFRLGELEYELADQPEDVPAQAPTPRVVNVHIPSDAQLDRQRCGDSLGRMRAFIRRFFPDWSGLPVMCTSWLLSPALSGLLPESSHIMRFQHLFRIVDVDSNAPDWREWVFQRNDAPVAELPERTSLQRSMKAYLLGGGRVGVGTGVLRTNATVDRVEG